MDTDFPAAHSMDTSWFAVDRDGRVAVFRSGEAGAVPLNAFAGDEAYHAEERLRELLPAGVGMYDIRGRCMPGGSPHAFGQRAWAGSSAPIVVLFSSLEPVRDMLTAGQATEIPASEGHAVLFRRLSEAQLNAFHALPECLGSFNAFDRMGVGVASPPSLAELGLYVYEHLTDNWISGPYGRDQIPACPLHIDALPADLRESIGQLRFDFRFADTPHLQPIELTECVSWEAAYVDVTGKHIRPIPGKEDEYATAYNDLVDSGKYQVEPPGQH